MVHIRSSIVGFVAFILLSSVFPSHAHIPAGSDEVNLARGLEYYEDLINEIGISPWETLNTDLGPLHINYSYSSPGAGEPASVEIYCDNYEGPPNFYWIYDWNSSQGGYPETEIDWYREPEMPASPYNITIYIEWDYNETITFYDYDNTDFILLEGTGMISDLQADPDTMPGTGMTNISWIINREYDDIDDVWFGIYDNNAMMWVVFDYTIQTYYDWSGFVQCWCHLFFPESKAGTFNVMVEVLDSWGYVETVNETLIYIEEMAPVNVSDLEHFEFEEDGFMIIDLNSLFYDANGDELSFTVIPNPYTNFTLEWLYPWLINVTPNPDWNGEERIRVYVEGGSGNNVSFFLYLTVVPVEDELLRASAAARTVLVDENEGYAVFDPLEFFVDPDGRDLAVSLGGNWSGGNATPVWSYIDPTESVMVEVDGVKNEGEVTLLRELEEGYFEFPATAWIGGEPVLNATGCVEVLPVNDLPIGPEEIHIPRNSTFTADLRDLFVDPDSDVDSLIFSIGYDGDVLSVSFDNTTRIIVIEPMDPGFVGESWIAVNITDGSDDHLYEIPVFVDPLTFTLTLNIEFEDWEFRTEDYDLTFEQKMVDFTIGPVTGNDNGTRFAEIVLEEGTYGLVLAHNLPVLLTYVQGERSGYFVPALDDVTLDMDISLYVFFPWIEYDEVPPKDRNATWDDIRFMGGYLETDDDSVSVVIPVDPEKENYGELEVYMVIMNDDGGEDLVEFRLLFWNGNFTLVLSDEDAFGDVKEGKRRYFFSDGGANTYTPTVNEFEFKDRSNGENQDVSFNALIYFCIAAVVVVLLVIILVLIIAALSRSGKRTKKSRGSEEGSWDVEDDEDLEEEDEYEDEEEGEDYEDEEEDEEDLGEDEYDEEEDEGDLEEKEEGPYEGDIGEGDIGSLSDTPDEEVIESGLDEDLYISTGRTPSTDSTVEIRKEEVRGPGKKAKSTGPLKTGRKIGSGGFADVYIGSDERGNRIAVKKPKESIIESMDEKMVRRFLSEAEHWKKLYANVEVKSGIVGIYDYGLEPVPFINMEYMDGGNLRNNMNKMSFMQKISCVNSILETLYDVHNLGLIHRDIKPENILRNGKGEWKIADWGLSKVLIDSGGSTTQAGTIKATLTYSAPEQIEPDTFGKVDRRTDIYQVGALAYELFTGKKPFEGDPGRVIFSILSKDPVHPSEVKRGVPRELGDAIMKALAKKKQNRWRDAMVFRDAINE